MKTLNLTDEEAATVHHLLENELLHLHEADWEGDAEHKEIIENVKGKLE